MPAAWCPGSFLLGLHLIIFGDDDPLLLPLVTVCLTGCYLFSQEDESARCIIAEGAPLLSTGVNVVSQSRHMRSLLQESAAT